MSLSANEKRRNKRISAKVKAVFQGTLITDLRGLFAEVREQCWPDGIQDKNLVLSICAYHIRNYQRERKIANLINREN